MKGCLLIHGFTGSPYEVEPLAEHLRSVTNWHIHAPTLPGHGQKDSLHDVDWYDWLHFAEQQCEQMLADGHEVHVIGFSMGGLIAAHLATKYEIERLVLLSPSVFSLHVQQMLQDFTQLFRHQEQREEVLEADWQRYKQKMMQTPVRAVFQFRKLVKALRQSIPYIQVPVLIVHGQKDSLVHPRSADYVFDQVQSIEKDIVYLPQSKHVVCHDRDNEKLFAAVEDFLVEKDEIHL